MVYCVFTAYDSIFRKSNIELKMAKLNYCIIKGGKEDPIIVYVANSDDTRLDASVMNSQHFQEIKEVLELHGFEHVIAMTFKNKFNVQPKIRPLISDLRSHGFIRSRKLEAYVQEQRERMTAIRETSGMMPLTISGVNQNMTNVPVFSFPTTTGNGPIRYGNAGVPIVNSKKKIAPNKYHTVGVGEKIDLYLYLFLRVNPTEDKSIDFDFECDFYSKSNTELRRYIKIIKCSFLRKESHQEGVMYLESEQTLRDILKSVDFLFYIRLVDPFDILSGQKPKSMVFSSIELKEYLNLDQKITMFLNVDDKYLEVISLSEKIRREKKDHDMNTQIPISILKRAVINVLTRMEQRMHYYSEEENYELAASYRKNQEYIQKKVELLSEMEEKGIEVLSNQEYEENFTMKDLEF